MSVFLELSRVITIELAAGRITKEEARAQLRANVAIAADQEIFQRVRQIGKISAWDNNAEKEAVCQVTDDWLSPSDL